MDSSAAGVKEKLEAGARVQMSAAAKRLHFIDGKSFSQVSILRIRLP
jgi:hypothetical protein